MKYSIIIPVFNRPLEIQELLVSLTKQTYKNFEVIVIEDGSNISSEKIVEKFISLLDIHYYKKENGGPAESRNYGSQKANGDFFIILDSDVILPHFYLNNVNSFLEQNKCDAFGGPDKAHPDFTNLQKSINYAMTSFFTTGGIRGGKKKMDKFYPRSFNMGIKAKLYMKLKGFSNMRFGEDIDFSIRLYEETPNISLIPEAWVWHKRRTDFKKFFKQVHNSGIARIHLTLKHSGTLKLVHLLPALFTLGLILCIFLGCFHWWAWIPIFTFSIIILIDSTIKNKNLIVGLLSIFASYIQLIGYGSGFLRALWRNVILKKEHFQAFKNNFYD